MKKILWILSLCGLSFTSYAQTASVEKSTYGIQTGFLGVWGHNESRLSDQIALRSEIGFDVGVFGSDLNNLDDFLVVPSIALEPKWYYNLKKRAKASKNTDGNSANFISIKTQYHPDGLILANANNLNFISDISIIPTLGMRRGVSKHFNYELGFGIGYIYYLEQTLPIGLDRDGLAANVHLRMGYQF